ncbi:MAG: hypothetical protein ACFE9T_11825 [Promethearchaeota archaeon]
MRNKLIAIIILLIGVSLITLGIMESQFAIIRSLYEQMAAIP